ncbi:MAG: hypothetical protein U9N50_07050 [Pseudomonadota bacterium]|nr:hypothetical protein [Pseudomonadota bacterium]
MNSIKAIFGGFFAIIFMGLLAQLIFLFVGMGFFSLVKKFPSLSFLAETTTVLLFAITALIAFLGGILTANLSRKAVTIHCLVVGSMAGTLTLVPTLVNGYEITVNGALLLVVFLLATVAGGLYWKKQQQLDSDGNPVAINTTQ